MLSTLWIDVHFEATGGSIRAGHRLPVRENAQRSPGGIRIGESGANLLSPISALFCQFG